jgi:hypothetical protein
MSPKPSKVFIIGGTGAQGLPIVQSLVADGKYSCRILTRDPNSERARSLQALGNVELFEGTFTSESDLRRGYHGCDAAFVNLDSFNVGEMAEIFWTIRCYELAVADGGIRFFVYSNLEYITKVSGYRSEFRCIHYDGKGRIGEWILWQAAEAAKKSSAMGVALFTTGPYLDSTIAKGAVFSPTIVKGPTGEDTVTWRLPITQDGAIPHVALDDCGTYVRWLFDHPDQANGMNLAVAIEHVHYSELAKAFANVTGHPARFDDVDMETFWKDEAQTARANMAAGYSADVNDPANMSFRESITGFLTIYKHSGYNKGLIQRDYALLDKIHPKRIRSVEEWFRLEDEKGRRAGKGSLWDRVQSNALQPVLKIVEDGFSSPDPRH